MDLSPYYLPFLLTLFAGLCTGIGGAMSFFSKSFNARFLSGSLGFSAGVMIYVSFVEIFPKANDALTQLYGEPLGYIYTTLGFFAGVAAIALIDHFIPASHNPHEMKEAGTQPGDLIRNAQLRRMSVFTALAIGIHNFPEGLATFMATLEDPALGISIAIAIAIHNVPEGVAIAVPMYYATQSKRKAFGFSLAAGLAEPVGAVLGYIILMQIFSEDAFGVVFAAVAGIMVYISLDELLPAAEKYGEHHVAIYGMIAGMMVMAISLIMLR